MKSSEDIIRPTPGQKVVAIGTSAGGLSALTNLVGQLPPDFAAPILVVQHISADAVGNVLLNALNQLKTLACVHAEDGMELAAAHLYLAPSDQHLMVGQDGKIRVTKGAHENRSRPAIDPLFRSAAVAFGSRLIGVVLTGYLDDGTSGLKVIQRCGGTCIIQDPKDAQYPDMPQNALNQVEPEYLVPLSAMGSLLEQLVAVAAKESGPVPEEIIIEAKIAERVLSDLPSVNALGDQVPFNCPGCGGVLWQVDEGSGLRFRCHVGHAYTAASLLAEQSKKMEETIWTALRMFEERKNLLTTMAKGQKGAALRSSLERAKLSEIHISRIKAILLANDKGTNGDVPT